MGCGLCPFDLFGEEVKVCYVGISIANPLCGEG